MKESTHAGDFCGFSTFYANCWKAQRRAVALRIHTEPFLPSLKPNFWTTLERINETSQTFHTHSHTHTVRDFWRAVRIIETTHPRSMKEYSAWSFLCLRVPVCPRSVEVWVSSKSLPSLSHRRTHTDGDVWTLRTRRYFIPLWKFFSFIDVCSFESLYANGDKSEPHVRSVESRKALRSWLHSQCGNAHPLLFFLSPSLSPPVCVDHPETGSSLFVFLKKGSCCFSFLFKVNMHDTLSARPGVDVHVSLKFSPRL